MPIIDMRIKFKFGTPTYDQFTVVVILNPGRRVIGMVVDSAPDIITLKPDQIKPASEIASDFGADYLIEIRVVEERMLILIDVINMMSSGAGNERKNGCVTCHIRPENS